MTSPRPRSASRDDVESKFLVRYLEERILERSPFETLDVPGVGALVRTAPSPAGRRDPASSSGCAGSTAETPEHAILRGSGLDYVSCSQFRVPVARVAAAQAAIRRPAEGLRERPVRVAVVAEYYPRPSDPALGVGPTGRPLRCRSTGWRCGCWRGAAAPTVRRPARRPAALRSGEARAMCPGPPMRDGIPVRYVRFASPPRPISYATWGRWAARPLGRALDELDAEWPFDLVHAHYAVPAGDAALRWMRGRAGRPPLVGVGARGRPVVRGSPSRALAGGGTEDAARGRTRWSRTAARRAGASRRWPARFPAGDGPSRRRPPAGAAPRAEPTLVTVAHLVPHKGRRR